MNTATATENLPKTDVLQRALECLEAEIRGKAAFIGHFRNASESYAIIQLQAERFWANIAAFGPEPARAYRSLILLSAFVVATERDLNGTDLLPTACHQTKHIFLNRRDDYPPVVSLYDAWGRISPLVVELRDQVHQALEGDPNHWFSHALLDILVQIFGIAIDLNLTVHAGQGPVVPLNG
jgi:hypothetical protein